MKSMLGNVETKTRQIGQRLFPTLVEILRNSYALCFAQELSGD